MAKVLHICSWFPSREHPTLGNFIQNHIEAISKQHQAYVLYACESQSSGLETEQNDSYTIVRVYFRKRLPLLSLRQALQRGWRFIKEQGFTPNLVHLHVAYPAGIFATTLPYPLLISEHFSGYLPYREHKWSAFQKAVLTKLYNQAEVFLPVSNELGEAIQNLGVSTPYQVIGNLVNTQLFKPAPVKAKKSFRFLHISTLQNSTKNITGLLHSFKAAADKYPGLELAIGGDGNILWLREEIARANIDPKQIHILSEMNRQEVAQEMQIADCFVLFSNVENQPVVILEALCCGIPVIATEVGAIPQIIDNSNGILVKPRDEKALQAAFIKLASNFDCDKEAIMQKAQATYSAEAIAQQFSEVYASVLPKDASNC